jgi:HMG (high mobility group) box
MSEASPPSPPHSTGGDRNKDRGYQQTFPDPFTPPLNMATPIAMSEYVSDPLDWLIDWNKDLPFQDHYGDPSMYHTAGQPVYYERQPAYYQVPPRQYTPTPPPGGYVDSGIHRRSGRALGSPESAKRHGQEPPSKRPPKRRAARTPKAGAPQLAAPLSELTKDYNIPVKDMEAWVNRSAEDRQKEAEKKNGYISRPMNSFMLYRSAYAERVKKYASENNHQVVSQCTGASWPMEPDHVRKFYEKLAIMERDNHALAHPTYKFAPNKNGKKRAREEDDDTDGEWGGSTRTKRSRTAVSSRRGDTPLSRNGSPFDDYYSPSPYQPVAYNPSAYDYQYPRGPAPPMYHDQGLAHGQYYQTIVRSYAPNVEDVSFGRVDNAFPPPQDQMLPLIGMPSVDGQHLLGSTDEHGAPIGVNGDMLDPRLGGNFQLQDFQGLDQPYASPPQAGFASEAFHPGQATLTDPHNIWTEPGQVGSEFDRVLQHLG